MTTGIITIPNNSWYNVITNGTALNYGSTFISPNSTSLLVSGTTLTSTTYCNPLPVVTTDGAYIYYNTVNGIIGSTILVQHSTDGEQSAWRQKYERDRQKKRLHAIHRAKGSIKRALRLMDNVGFGDDIRIFLGGDDIEIAHPESMFKFVLTKHRHPTLIEKTINGGYSTPYHLRLFTKTNVHVANLCVVLEDTPILDQILAVSMFIRTGDEEHILQKANWSSLTDDEDTLLQIAVERPQLCSKFRHHRFSNTEIKDIFSS